MRLIRSRRSLLGVGPGSVMSLSTVGRKSGKRRVTPMGYVPVDDDTVWAVSEHGARSDWYRNARKAGTVKVHAGDRQRTARVRVLPDEDPAAVLRRMNRVVALANRALWDRPAVVEIRFEND
ncbi:MAG TPA: nitroreductase family deazaflavin-dependent oxidoreductase [Actinomycetota bacterium]|nr:nitroreductase family deazaflavin-dependent oxidoreductase [Actinomycetota bacterium]